MNLHVVATKTKVVEFFFFEWSSLRKKAGGRPEWPVAGFSFSRVKCQGWPSVCLATRQFVMVWRRNWRPCTFHDGGVNKVPGSFSTGTEGSMECRRPVFIWSLLVLQGFKEMLSCQ